MHTKENALWHEERETVKFNTAHTLLLMSQRYLYLQLIASGTCILTEIELAYKTVKIVVLKIAWQNVLGESRIVMYDHVLSTLHQGKKVTCTCTLYSTWQDL